MKDKLSSKQKIQLKNLIDKFSLSWDQTIPYLLLILIIIITCLLEPKVFSLEWLGIKADATLSLIMAATGQAIVLFVGGLDLSIGGLISLTNSLSALYMGNSFISILGMCILVLLIGAVAGAINGIVIVKFKIQPFLVTLATWSIWGGIALWILPTDGGEPPKAYLDAMSARPLGIPVSLFIIIFLIIFWIYFRNTRFAISMFAVGYDEKSAFYNSINVGRVKVIAFIFSGVFGALAGLARTANVASGSPTGGNGFILLSICAAVMGGVRITGGKGSIIGVIVGAFVLKLIQDVLVFANISSYWTSLVQGVILISAIAIYAIAIKNRKIKMGVGV